MSANERIAHFAKGVRRQHKLNKAQVDKLGWVHPRPARDPRLVYLHIAFIWVSAVQLVLGPPPNSVQGMAFGGYLATAAFSVLMIVCCGLVLVAAFCKSQYDSFGYEMAGTFGFTGVFLIYGFATVVGVTDWFATNTAAIAVALFLGNLDRCQTLIRRLW